MEGNLLSTAPFSPLACTTAVIAVGGFGVFVITSTCESPKTLSEFDPSFSNCFAFESKAVSTQ